MKFSIAFVALSNVFIQYCVSSTTGQSSERLLKGKENTNITLSPTQKPTTYCDPNAAKSPLCGAQNLFASVPGDCKSTKVDFGNFEPCCEAQTVLSDPCHIEDGFGKCRTATITNAVCSSQNMECQAIALKMSFEVYRKPGTCCETCSCYGDPHCESFNGVIDTWLLCDARVRDSPTSTTCHISQTSCVKQLDHNGNPCVWRKPLTGSSWLFGLWGSQCMFSTGRQDLPEMTMYKADDFSLKLRLGERGIIVQARVEDNGKLYIINAEDCWDDFLKNKNPWRASDTATGPLTDPNWLPNIWKGQLLPGNDRLWSIFGLKSGIKANIRCTRNMVKVEGKSRLGLPRLNIEEIVEPVDPKNRTSASGFCVEDKINKMKSSYEVTDRLKELGVCLEDQGGLLVGRLLCSKGVTEAGLDLCKQNWCKKVRPDWEKCFLDIGRFGWARTFCASQVLQNPDPISCISGDCIQCVSDISDFGWEEAVPIWENFIKKNGGVTGPCLTVDKLPNKLDVCQKGIEIQYEETPGNWKTFKAIPDSVNLCSPKVEFISTEISNSPLFAYPIRIKQCSLDANCLEDQCTPELGFKAVLNFESNRTDTTNLVGLVQSNNLICNPAKWPKDKLGCIRIDPPKACPCANNRG